MRTHAIIVAAGAGLRAGGGVPKQYRAVAGQPLLRHAVERLLGHPAITGVSVVINPECRALYDAAMAGLTLPEPIAGGATRQESVLAGLESLAADPPDIVLVHDAARAFVPDAVIDALVAAFADAGVDGACPALPQVDSLRRGEEGRFSGSVDRDALWRVQTPQAFRYAALLAAHRVAASGATDEVAIALAAGLRVAITPGDERAFKVTEPADFAKGETMTTYSSRAASGFDVHKFGPGDHVWLCGVKVPHDHGLIGHSDADVGLHALTDALLGTIAAGDIGDHFPPSDERWRGAASDQFLAHAATLVRERGGLIDHVDVTLICERPKVGPHREAMRARIAAILGLGIDRVSVKATTTEKLGFTGRQEGIAAQAMASVRLPEQDA
ncbi:bifunctional 2-C-methyl-D-erythritol 4-phosphate cytidylyltransferase/2-C-methyl-D-erythritol 2,4-cyclodiphosphate synthase [Sandarakinorhabdus limnophila]|uniref:bifunctional 2-C-methyl-D-erythritol 4-phosphate cytidylyltransferase/2-C-methyl-D-erythritol 2,4-cyclodiphosphate synthase n=1 Tax=Sandarakinorhabdus limnophila TaxID=210512 RepID=UPI0026EE354E|nr:bifunctional 2-C-methyl-D-erythritol 4-phosphate cytidylyltransferase/2-C-methyl-D-erythritol 2,4-cyclodiphosphate synthase [Sandarakinorhabdus limnophila]